MAYWFESMIYMLLERNYSIAFFSQCREKSLFYESTNLYPFYSALFRNLFRTNPRKRKFNSKLEEILFNLTQFEVSNKIRIWTSIKSKVLFQSKRIQKISRTIGKKIDSQEWTDLRGLKFYFEKGLNFT